MSETTPTRVLGRTGERVSAIGLGGCMKPLANGLILKSKTVTAIEGLHYALNLPTSVVITGCDSMEILDQALEVARTFRPMSDVEVQALLARTAKAASKGEFELFKTTSIFDSTTYQRSEGRSRGLELRPFAALRVTTLSPLTSYLLPLTLTPHNP